MTGASITSVPNELSKKHGIDYIEKICNNSCIKHWFTQNYELREPHSKITAIPLGIDYHTVQTGKCLWNWGPQKTALEQEEELTEIAKKQDFESRKNKTFDFFHFKKFKRHNNYITTQTVIQPKICTRTNAIYTFSCSQSSRCTLWCRSWCRHCC